MTVLVTAGALVTVTASVALALARLSDDRALAERLGGRAKAHAATMSWAAAIARLVIV